MTGNGLMELPGLSNALTVAVAFMTCLNFVLQIRESFAGLHKSSDEGIGRFRHSSPPVIDRQGMPAPGHLEVLGDARVVLLLLEGRFRNRDRNRVILLRRDDHQRSALGVLTVHL